MLKKERNDIWKQAEAKTTLFFPKTYCTLTHFTEHLTEFRDSQAVWELALRFYWYNCPPRTDEAPVSSPVLNEQAGIKTETKQNKKKKSGGGARKLTEIRKPTTSGRRCSWPKRV
ncbi:hypothetical protein XENORESO_001314 [Xenotaenia resolanae]|uniref:Uncharacterized protein n=1 Tax=Xenotaenia resolanae TaxID=208358 RepID=A0ABV0WAZ7_9TELE